MSIFCISIKTVLLTHIIRYSVFADKLKMAQMLGYNSIGLNETNDITVMVKEVGTLNRKAYFCSNQ